MKNSPLARLARAPLGAAALCLAAPFLAALSPQAAAQTQLPPPAYGQADERQDRIEALETQLRDATAENERLQFELLQAQREVNRLRGLVGELAGVNQSLAEPPASGQAAPPPPRDGAGAAPTNAQQRATGALGTMPAAQAPPAPAPAQNQAAAAPADPATAYGLAREYLVNGKYAEAEAAFGDFLQTYPRAETAPDARYWFAFTQLARNNYRDAAANFVQYLQTSPRGPRAPEAQARLGMALAGLGQNRQACAAWAALPSRYPNAPRGARDLAAREALALRC